MPQKNLWFDAPKEHGNTAKVRGSQKFIVSQDPVWFSKSNCEIIIMEGELFKNVKT